MRFFLRKLLLLSIIAAPPVVWCLGKYRDYRREQAIIELQSNYFQDRWEIRRRVREKLREAQRQKDAAAALDLDQGDPTTMPGCG